MNASNERRERYAAALRQVVLSAGLFRNVAPHVDPLIELADTENAELRARLSELEPYAPTGFDPIEDIEYKVAGDWGVDSADTADEALAAVRKALEAYPHCGAYAEQRITRRWDDGSEWYGPWTALIHDGAA